MTATDQTEHQNLNDFVFNLSPQTIEYMQEKSDYYISLFNSAGHPFRGLKRLYHAADVANEKHGSPDIKCKRGCSFCCSIRVAATQVEADLIVSHCKQTGIDIDTEKLEQLKDLNETQYMFSPHKRCTFLAEDNTCKIYDVRPMNCRNHNAVTDPKLCDTDTNPHGEIASDANIEAYIPAIALLSVQPGYDNLAKQLLKSINKI